MMPRLIRTSAGYAQALGNYVAVPGELGADEVAPTTSPIEELRAEVQKLRLASEREERHRRIATYATIAGALFAAARLGVIWVPFIRERRRRQQ